MLNIFELLLRLSIWVWAVSSPFIIVVVTVVMTVHWYEIGMVMAVFGGLVGAVSSTVILFLVGAALGALGCKMYNSGENKYGN